MATRTAVIALLFLSVFATGCKKDDNPVGNNPVTTITVVGFIKDAAGEPINGVAVIVIGKAPVTSGTDGSFSISGVTTPYDIIMVLSTQKVAIVYKGLTRSDPTLVFTSFLGTTKTATIQGTVPIAATKTTQVFFVSGTTLFSTRANQTTGAYTINATWTTAATSFVGKVHVVRYTPVSSGFPTDYDAAGEKDLTLSAGGSFTVDFSSGELTDPSEQTISGTVSRPVTSYILSTRELYINFGNSILFLSGQSGTPPFTDDFNITVPSVAGAAYGIYTGANQTATPNNRSSFFYRAGIAPGTTGLTLTLAAAPQLTTPVNNGTNIDTSTSFLFSPGGATGVHQVAISPTVSTNPRFIIYTSGPTVTIPNLASVGLGLPASASYNWSVTQFSPLSSVNDAASSTFFAQTTGTGGNVGFGFSETFGFTTKP